MKKIIFFAFAAMVALSSCGVGGGRIKTDIDSLSYAIGVDLGTNLFAQDSTWNANLIAKGIIDVYKGKNKMSQDSAGMIIEEYFTVKLPLAKLKVAEEFLAKVEKENSKVVKTESGLLYEIIEPGDLTNMVQEGDTFLSHYTLSLSDGTLLQTTTGNMDNPAQLTTRLIPGFKEALKYVGKGGKIKLWIHPSLGYGEMGNRGIGPNEVLVYDEVEIVDITHMEPAPEEGK